MPPLLRTPDLFIIPDSSISWASMMIATLIVLDVSTEIGAYHIAIEHCSKYGKDAKNKVNAVALQVVVIGMTLIVLSPILVTHLTIGMDSRMALVLEGISRLEAAHLLAFISVKTPRWIGVYHSPEQERCIKHVGEGIYALKFHVRYTITQYFALVYCLMLPFAAHPKSALLGFALGFIIELLIVYAHNGDGERQYQVAFRVSIIFAFCSSFMFADGCHYIQVVWGSGLIFSEWGLGIATFFASFAAILGAHFYHLQRTVRKFSRDRRISSHDRKEKLAISIIQDHFFESRDSYTLSESQRATLQQEMKQDETKQSTIWSLLKERLVAPNDFVIFSRFELGTGVVISILSLFVVIINIFATRQINVVRLHYHRVHDQLYGRMNEGPVCAFDNVGGIVRTFDDSKAAHSANYTLAHCGACGQCSTWNDLRLQYTTRNLLAKESARCAKKSLIYGRDAVQNCLKEEPIGFTDQCATCWTEDILCARSHCAFIFLQSNLINTVSNFQVGEDAITAATCEEAMCELEFVPCSGANRRRMNITSSIARPGRQLCDIVDVDWAVIFGDNNDSRNDSRNDEL